MPSSRLTAVASVAAALLVFVAFATGACTTKEPTSSTYFERTISPILVSSCVRTNTGAGCHVADARGNAFGNLDLATFEGLAHRRDLLLDYGPYGQPSFLVKNVAPFAVEVQSFDGQKTQITIDVRHTGGPIFDATAGAYQTLRRWIESGATENNSGAAPKNLVRLPCATTVPVRAGFDPSKDPTTADYATFRDRVGPVIHDTCAASNCHGTASNELYLTCGDSPEQQRWNYFTASEYLSQTPEQSEIVRRPLSPSQGGSYHEGGVIFPSVEDPGYRALVDWANAHGPPTRDAVDPNLLFFAHKVQPILVKKGCMMVQCHSAAMFHDYRLKGGAGGSFSFSATRRNYALTLAQMSLESADPGASRLVRKNLYRPEVKPGSNGIAHRGGPLLEDFGEASPSLDACAAGKYDFDNGPLDAIPSYCVVAEWLKRERTSRELPHLSAIVYIKRPIAGGLERAQDFDVYTPGADIHVARSTLSAASVLEISEDTSKTAGCGLDPKTADIKRPGVSWDGKRIAFAARSSATEPLNVYEMNADGSACAKHPEINAGVATQNGLLIHNFDPTYSPPDDAGVARLVFASTRGNLSTAAYDYAGPQRTPADPSKPNANLYALDPDKTIRQLTFNLNLERFPTFMSDGRIIFTAEKRAPGFYQLALRRVNLDGGDYHPLYAQRGSIGYREASRVVELADKNFAAIFADQGAPHGGGTLAIFNRSLGVDFTSANAGDYPIDSSVIDPAAPMSPEPSFFLHSLRFPDATSSGHLKRPTTGAYTSPAALPEGRVLVSYGAAGDLAQFDGDYDLYVLDPATGQKTRVLGEPGTAEIEAVAVYARGSRGIFASSLDEPNGHTTVLPGKTEADVTLLDAAVLGSLLFQNTPTGRLIESGMTSIDVYEDMPPADGVTSLAGGASNVVNDEFGGVYVRRRLIGHVPLLDDSSAHFSVPGGLPILLRLGDTETSKAMKLPRTQRESMVFAPGEHAHQSFKREFFDGLCASCHGAISGRPLDVAIMPDILTQASNTAARGSGPTNLNIAPAQRGPIEGPKAEP